MELKKDLIDTAATENGVWQSPGEEFEDFEILTRGFGDKYADMKAARMRNLSAPYNGDVSKVPNALLRKANVDCLEKHVILDIRGLNNNGEPVTLAAFCELIRSPEGNVYYTAAFTAAGLVSTKRVGAIQEAAGN